MKVTDERLGQLSESQISQPILLPDELSTHEGIDMSKSSVWTYRKIRKNLAEFIGEKY